MSESSLIQEPRRVLALDAVRGLAILMMCLSGLVPEGLPNAMYHGYYPRYLPDAAGVMQAVADPHTHRWQWSSFTWVDWVFPMFLFAMGAAFPLALGRRLDQGVSAWRLVPSILGRGITLIAFAVYVRQITPGFIEQPTSPTTWCLGLLGFVLLFAVFTRLPRGWSKPRVRAVRGIGVALAVGLLIYLNSNDGDDFSFAQNDIIILLLGHMAIAGSLLWLITHHHPKLRLLSLLAVYLAHDKAMYSPADPARDTLINSASWIDPLVNFPERLLDLRWLTDLIPGLPQGVLDLSPLYDFTWYKFLFIVIPATVMGDLLRHYLQSPSDGDLEVQTRWSAARYTGILLVTVGLIVWVLCCVNNFGRVIELPVRRVLLAPLWLGVTPLLIAGLILTRVANSPMQRLLRSLMRWAGLWLALGLLVEPWEVGITKGPPVPLSYHFVSLGLSILLLCAMTVWIDVFKRPSSLLVLNGQNPMLAYVGIRNLLAPLLALPLLAPLPIGSDSINGWVLGVLPQEPWIQMIWAVIQTLLLAAVVCVFTRRRVVWRS